MDQDYMEALRLYISTLGVRAVELSAIANAITLTGDSIHEMAQALIVIGDAYNFEASKMSTVVAVLNVYFTYLAAQQKTTQDSSSKGGDTKNGIIKQKDWVEKQVKEMEFSQKILEKQANQRIAKMQQQLEDLQKQLEEIRKLITPPEDK